MGGRGGASSGGGGGAKGKGAGGLKVGQTVTVNTPKYGRIRGTVSSVGANGFFQMSNKRGLDGAYKGKPINQSFSHTTKNII